MKHLFFATGNESKFNETKTFLEDVRPGLQLEQLPIDVPEIQSDDPDEIVRQKIGYVQRQTSLPFIVDDMFFEADRLSGPMDRTIRYEGLRELFNEGDSIQAVARVALYNFGDSFTFEGSVRGKLGFSLRSGVEVVFALEDFITMPDGRSLSEELADPDFRNHRILALVQLADYLRNTDNSDSDKKVAIGERWGTRAAGWQDVIKDESSYVNHEDNYERVNTMIRKYAPLVSGAALEIGCGTGEAGRILKSSNSGLNLLATDISDGMLDEARKLADENKLDIEYKKLDITSGMLAERTFSIVVSRGVVVSHLPKSDIFDFLEGAARHTAQNGYLIFDFIQDTSVGEIEKPIDSKNEFTLSQMDEILTYCGMTRVEDAGSDAMRVRVVCYKKMDSKEGKVDESDK